LKKYFLKNKRFSIKKLIKTHKHFVNKKKGITFATAFGKKYIKRVFNKEGNDL
jgi:hypothetical protein